MSKKPLSCLQSEVAELAARGLSMQEIASELRSTSHSVKVMLSRYVYPFYEVKSQMALMRYWMEHVEQRGDCSKCLLFEAHKLGAIEQ